MAVLQPAPGERLVRILRVEREKGLTDRTVYGGIDLLLKNLLAQTTQQTERPILAAMQCLEGRNYAQLDANARRAWIDRVLTIASDSTGSPGVAPQPAAISRPTPRATPAIRPTPPARNLPARGALSPVARTPSAAPTPAQRPNTATTPSIRPTGAATAPRLPKPAQGGAAKQLQLDDPVTKLPRIGAGRAAALGRLAIETVRDLLFHLPHRYDDFSRIIPIARLLPGEQATVVGRVWSANAVQVGKNFRRRSSELVVGDESGNIRVMFFNNPYPAQQLHTNDRVTLSGRAALFHGRPQFESPEWELVEPGSDLEDAVHTGRLVPIYPLTQGVQNRALRSLVRLALDACVEQIDDPLPLDLRRANDFPALPDAVRQIHYPADAEALERARRRLAYDELFELQIAVMARRAQRVRTQHAEPLPFATPKLQAYEQMLPFPLTGAQRRAIDGILGDIAGGTPMARLLQGDVGSGKTVVAAAALLAAVANGQQSSLMAPTEILAEQHFRTLRLLLGTDGAVDDGAAVFETELAWLELGRPLRVALLRGGLKAATKRAALSGIASGAVDIAVGTQALIQSGVAFPRLALSVIDEQHRFGVVQRTALAEKGANVHQLVMTATPIPRTLQLSVYGDLDLSIINEMPPGRQPVKTRALLPLERGFAYQFVREQVALGHQAFVVCPLVEESESVQARAATEEYERLRHEIYPDLALLLLHGRMPPAEKDRVMQAFREREAAILVATSVVEVGIDIPNATIILIEGADRFGLAQLHQFRGRVGRGGQQAFCLLLSDSESAEAAERLALLERISDGFKLAEADLKLRGAGDYFGVRQSGMPALRVARITDTPILELARNDAARIIERDPLLNDPALAEMRARVERRAATAGAAN
jgi:ATP-dependent DNA helicase RecG